MAKTSIWYPHKIEKYRRKTGHLTLAEHGAYRLMMDAYWDRKGPIPAEDRRLRKVIGADEDEWNEVKDAVLEFFVLTDDGWYHEAIEENLREAEKKHDEKCARMEKARQKRWANRQEIDQNIEQTSDQIIDQTIEQETEQNTDLRAEQNTSTQSQLQSQLQVSKETPIPKKNKQKKYLAGEILSTILDGERVSAVLSHRKAIKKPLTARAETLLCNEFSKCPDPNEAADLMVLRSWVGFKSDWYFKDKAEVGKRARGDPGTDFSNVFSNPINS